MHEESRSRIKTLQDELIQRDHELQVLYYKLEVLEGQSDGDRVELVTYKQAVQELQEQKASFQKQLENQLKTQQEQLETQREQLETQQKQLETQQKQLETQQEQLTKQQEQLETQPNSNDYERFDQKQIEIIKKSQRGKEWAIENFREIVKQLKETVSELRKTVEKQQREKTIDDEMKNGKKERSEQAKARIKDYIFNLKKNIRELREAFGESNQKLDESNKKLDESHAKLVLSDTDLKNERNAFKFLGLLRKKALDSKREKIKSLQIELEDKETTNSDLQDLVNKYRWNEDGKLLFSEDEKFDKLLKNMSVEDVNEIEFEGLIKPSAGQENSTWDFNNEYKVFEEDENNFTLVGLIVLKRIIEKFRLKGTSMLRSMDAYDVVFRAYLYNRFVNKINDILKEINRKHSSVPLLQFQKIKIFTDENQAKSFAADDIGKLPLRDLKTPPVEGFVDDDFENVLESAIKRYGRRLESDMKQNRLGDSYEMRAYQIMREEFIDKQFCPLFHSSKYIFETGKTIDDFIKFMKDDSARKKDQKFDIVEMKILEALLLTKGFNKNNCIVVELKDEEEEFFEVEQQYQPVRPVPRMLKSLWGLGSRGVQKKTRRKGGGLPVKFSGGTVRRVQNVIYYNIIKTVRWRYYANKKKSKEPIELTMFKDYLLTLIVCIFLLGSGQDKLAYGTFVDQILSMGLCYEFQDLTAILLPYYLPFT